MRPGECSDEIPIRANNPSNNGLCNITPEEKDFVCFDEGFVPSPTDCNKYYHCKEKTTAPHKANLHTCPEKMMYNKKDKQCNLFYSPTSCKMAACDNSNGIIKLMYANSKQYWAKCVKKDGEPFMLAGACPDGEQVDLTSVFLPPRCI